MVRPVYDLAYAQCQPTARSALTVMFYNSLSYSLMRRLPVSAGSAFGGWMAGKLAPRQMPLRSARAARNLAILRPDLDDAQARAMLDRRWRNMGRFIAELPSMDRLLGPDHLAIEDHAAYRAVVDGDGRLIVVSLHIGHWDLIAAHLKLQIERPLIGVHQLPDDPAQARMLAKARSSYLEEAQSAGEGAARKILRHLGRHDRGFAYILLDERLDRQVAFPTFGRPLEPRGNVSIALRLARASKARILPVYLAREDGPRFTLRWHAPLDPAEMSQQAMFAALDAWFGRAALDHLDQWLALQDMDLAQGDAPAQGV
ncbi:lysophospholipid acyltransferase family protein [Sphingobium ummariense]|uniref:Lauroyl acyltransferase n=1 Tax=Sphingobium ummariense RL-3 TaxID=1346791 RepID=T0J0H2_9SPHN|nr:hypothetical protein [Sphingobium ummariense]EQB30307.1 hypothetical protein M529_20785 [Sphingobium ummariense RL-3]